MKRLTTISKAYDSLYRRFVRQKLPTPALDARIIIGHACSLNPEQLVASPERPITPLEAERIRRLAGRRADFEPIAAITGKKEFYGLELMIAPGVFIPRPETELLIDGIIDFSRRTQIEITGFIELGCGSGAISIALLNELNNANGTAIDIDRAAINCTLTNSKVHKVLNRLRIIQADFTIELPGDCAGNYFDLVVSNPPYISASDLDLLPPDIINYEPRNALYGGVDGLDGYRKIIPLSHKLLNKNGMIALEAGINQSQPIKKMLTDCGFRRIEIIPDLAGIDRVIVGVNS